SITAILDIWGLRLISECSSSLIKAITKGVKLQFLISNQCIGSEYLSFLPNEIMMKIGNVFSNLIILDSSNIINIDGANGKAALFTSIDVLGFSYMKIFEDEWKKAVEIKNLNKTESMNQLKAVQIIKFIEDLSCFSTSIYLYSVYLSNLSSLSIFNTNTNTNTNNNNNNNTDSYDNLKNPASTDCIIHPVSSYPDRKETDAQDITSIDKIHRSDEIASKIYFNKNYVSFINYLNKYGINLNDYSIDDLFQIVDLSLRMNYSGKLQYDKNNNILSIYSKENTKSLVIMTILLSSYFLNLKYEIDITPKISKKSLTNNEIETDTFYIKFYK
ncbi:MAG TPA: hypothetical protein VFM31_11295, partial [Nitrososphaeraceae archaeon]|nr:hypothetical protein [Nitrososphaeraceae archaeon]